MITCRVLGPPVVQLGDDAPPPELLWRKNLALLVYLARSPKRTRSRDHVTGLLWPDKPEAAARHSLRESLRVLRRALGDASVRTEGTRIQLVDGIVELDADRFLAFEAADEWEAAAALVQGEFLEGFGVPDASAYEDWLAAERQEWQRRSVRALVRAAELALRGGHARAAAGHAERALRLDPGAEQASAALMRALMLEGDRAGALAAFAHVRAPSAALAGLADRVRHQREWRLDDSVPVAAEAGAELRRAPLVGREGALATLLDVLDGCRRSGRAAAGVILSDSGLGKSRLVEEVAQRARLESMTVVSIRAVAADASGPGSGLLGLARGGLLDAPGVAAAPPEALATLAAALPSWAERFRPGPALDPAEATHQLRAALQTILRVTAEERAVLVAADDAHWLDEASLLTLTAATRDLADLPFALVLAAQPEPGRPEIDDLRSRLGRDLPGAAVRLPPLDEDGLRALARWAVPEFTDEALDRLVRRLAVDSAGVPLLALELLHAVALGLDLGAIAGSWPEPYRTLDHTLPGDLPDAIVAAIRVGFRRLTADGQAALAAAAVLPGPVEPARLARATELSTDRLDHALDELEWQRWLQRDGRGYAFVARIVHDVVSRDMLTEGQRQRYVERAGS